MADDKLADLARQIGIAPELAPGTAERARNMINSMTPEEVAGLRATGAMRSALGWRAAKAALRSMIPASGPLRGLATARWRRIPAAPGSGCIRVDYVDAASGAPSTSYLALGECPAAHDFGAQLAKLRPRVAPGKWDEVLKSISYLVFIGRRVYNHLAEDNRDFIQMTLGAEAGAPGSPYLNYKVDMANTTLYLNEAWPTRVGVFIYHANEKPADADADADEAAPVADLD